MNNSDLQPNDFRQPDLHKASVTRRLFGGGWRKPIKDEYGDKWCNCLIPNITSNHGIGKGQAYCLRCHSDWYH